MKFYDSIGPNPKLVRMFAAEKGFSFPQVEKVDIMAGANRQQPYLSKNPAGQMPALELDDGRVISEPVAICEYLEEKYPKPPLIGTTAEERAETRMWTRRAELNITEHLYNGFRFAEGLPLFKNRIRTVPEAAPGLKAIAKDGLTWLDAQMAGRDSVVPISAGFGCCSSISSQIAIVSAMKRPSESSTHGSCPAGFLLR